MKPQKLKQRNNQKSGRMRATKSWFLFWREFSGPIREQSKAKPIQPRISLTLNWKLLQDPCGIVFISYEQLFDRFGTMFGKTKSLHHCTKGFLLEVLQQILSIVECNEWCSTSRNNNDRRAWFWNWKRCRSNIKPITRQRKPNRPTIMNIKERQVSDYSNISEN